jgi:S1-C subfamily serine protease
MASWVLKSVNLKSVLLVAMAFPRIAPAQTLKPEEIYQKLLPSIVTIQVVNSHDEHFVGAAFLAFSNGIAVTSWHVISDATNVSARFAGGQPLSVLGLIDKDEKHDLALIRLDVTNHPLVQLNTNFPAIGSRACVIGAPKGFEFSITDGLLSQIQTVDGYDQFQVSCPISGGNSGGPLINDRGEVIGITSWTKRDAQNLSFATPARFLAGLNPSLPPVSWPQATIPSKPLATTRPANAKPVATPLSPEKNVLDLKEFLQSSVGKLITVAIFDGDDEKQFDIVVPPDFLKTP